MPAAPEGHPWLRALRCPGCGGRLRATGSSVACRACGRGAGSAAGVVDLTVLPSPAPGGGWLERTRLAAGWRRHLRPRLDAQLGTTGVEERTWLVQWFRPVDGWLLELASGGGDHAAFLADRFGADRLVASDLDPAALRSTRARVPHAAATVRADAHALPWADGSLGGVNCFGGLQLFAAPAVAVAEVARCLAPGAPFTGLLTRDRPGLLQRVAGRATGMRFVGQEELLGWLGDAGLEVLATHSSRWMTLFAARSPR